MVAVEIASASSRELDGHEAYEDLLAAIKQHVAQAQKKVMLAANEELVALYMSIGRELLARQEAVGAWEGRGDALAHLADDLAQAFPGMRGLSSGNLYRMRRFAEAWGADAEDEQLFATLLRKVSWSHHVRLLQKLDDRDDRLWYAQKAVEYGWSSRVLAHQIDTGLRQHQGVAPTNFAATLPEPDSELAQEILKDEYALDFVRVASGASEADVEGALTLAVSDFLLELGGRHEWAFVGRQVRLEIDGDDFIIDLLLYHRRLNRLVVVELKIGKFDPRDVGQLLLYLGAVDDKLRIHEEPSIGLILCRESNRTVVEYTLGRTALPMGVSHYSFSELERAGAGSVPDELLAELPSREEIASRYEKAIQELPAPEAFE